MDVNFVHAKYVVPAAIKSRLDGRYVCELNYQKVWSGWTLRTSITAGVSDFGLLRDTTSTSSTSCLAPKVKKIRERLELNMNRENQDNHNANNAV